MSQFRLRTSNGAWPRLARVLAGAACLVGVVFLNAPARAGMAALDPAVAQFEQDYITSTIDHHAGGVALAELGLEKTENQTLLDLSADISAAQAQEIEQLQWFLSDWYGREKSPMIQPMAQQDIARLSALDGRAFDVDYSETFIMHHREVIESSQEVLARAEHEALREFAQGVIEMQTAEIPVFQSVIDGGATAIPLPAPVAMGAIGLVGAGLATWRQRRKQFA